jgi:feruloyl-CoA synthase
VASQEVVAQRLPGGGWSLRSPQSLGVYPRCVGDMLVHWARTAPDRMFLAERQGDVWRAVTYAQALAAVEGIAQHLLDRGLDPARPVVTLSPNSVEHGLMLLGAMHAGLPVAPVSPSYALASKDFRKLRHVLDLLSPSLLYLNDGAPYAEALRAALDGPVPILTSGSALDGVESTPFGQAAATPAGASLRIAFRAIDGDTIAKILMTSGSTGMPKGVINTQRMMCANQQAYAQAYPFFAEQPPVQLSWLPWNHTAGGNHVFNLTLRHGGSLYIDDGRPVPGEMERTVRNLRELALTSYTSVPLGYAMLLPHLEQDPALRQTFFSDLRYLGCAGAALPETHRSALQSMAIQVRGAPLLFGTNWGATETAPTVTAVHFETTVPGCIGLPIPGGELRLVPTDGKLELRVRGPSITPGYWRQPEQTAKAFDEEGFYRTGDAGRLVDENDPKAGVRFDGRVAEDFKLLSGTWVSVGSLRVKAIQAAGPYVQDVVVTGHNRLELGLLAFPSEAACRALCPELPADAPMSEVVRHPKVRSSVRDALAEMAARSTGSSTRPTRALLLAQPPSLAASEITEKGYINQRAVLENRASEVERLYAPTPDDDVLQLV